MLDDFIANTLAQVDDLAELKVSLVALSLLEAKLAATPFVTEGELLNHPAIRHGLSFPTITLRPALQRAVARGTLLCASVGEGELCYYFVNDEAGRRAVEAIQAAQAQPARSTSRSAELLARLAFEIERLEVIEAYAMTPEDLSALEERLARGYTEAEIIAALRVALRAPRPRHTPPRTLRACLAVLDAQPPAAPSEYYQVIVAKAAPPPEEIVNLRERLGREPTGREYDLVRTATGMFGLRAVLDGLKRVTRDGYVVDVNALIPLLAEREEAILALQRADARTEAHLRELVALYESAFGLPPTATVAEEMRLLWEEVSDLSLWRSVFAYAAGQNKRNWFYVKKLLQQPSPDVFTPLPVNETAQFAFAEYKKRVNRTLDGHIAADINALATQITDVARWVAAFDKAAEANALRWDYIRKVLTASPQEKRGGTNRRNGRPGETTQRKGRTYSRPQVEYTEADREAARERARQRIAGRRQQQEDRP
ncbi:hypothetical protein [Candidatus Roseilinea sp. NK_OTU-006]|jgi:hypothetical protein|uniref:hypothetical protein n=1 Tax=Candidatus Roseilinea sp. NK_OTU-006 TaxID=2704250 RepID=UPI00145EBD80|nr:hypothetical protein [Candidatus Roseilinea sp. NK_OTU-006]